MSAIEPTAAFVTFTLKRRGLRMNLSDHQDDGATLLIRGDAASPPLAVFANLRRPCNSGRFSSAHEVSGSARERCYGGHATPVSNGADQIVSPFCPSSVTT